jgi:predicted DNA-binding protein with PD1-like motif
MGTEWAAEFETGRHFLARIASADLLEAVAEFCRRRAILAATFRIAGAVSRFTIGVYDPTQQVYVTHAEESPREVVACSGTVSARNGDPVPAAHIVLADANGRVTGGKLFSETRAIWAELVLRELIGPPPTRRYDGKTGLELWDAADSGESARAKPADLASPDEDALGDPSEESRSNLS